MTGIFILIDKEFDDRIQAFCKKHDKFRKEISVQALDEYIAKN